jgi:hypothetical protein
MLCFEISKNGRKLARSGLRESGVLSLLLCWVGKGPGASTRAAATAGPIAGLDFRVGGSDTSDPSGDQDVAWIEGDGLKVGDDIQIRLLSAESADEPARREPSQPAARQDGGARLIGCSFCGEMRQIEPESIFKPGIAGATVFICLRCIVMAERMLDDRLPQLFHLTRAADQTCSFCATEHTAESAASRQAHMCRACIDMIMKDEAPSVPGAALKSSE